MTTGTTTAIPISAGVADNTEPAAPEGDPEAPPGCYCMPNTEGDQCQGIYSSKSTKYMKHFFKYVLLCSMEHGVIKTEYWKLIVRPCH